MKGGDPEVIQNPTFFSEYRLRLGIAALQFRQQEGLEAIGCGDKAFERCWSTER